MLVAIIISGQPSKENNKGSEENEPKSWWVLEWGGGQTLKCAEYPCDCASLQKKIATIGESVYIGPYAAHPHSQFVLCVIRVNCRMDET